MPKINRTPSNLKQFYKYVSKKDYQTNENDNNKINNFNNNVKNFYNFNNMDNINKSIKISITLKM